MKLSREVKTALLVIFGILLFVYLFNYLKGKNLFDATRTYYTSYQNVEGLVPSTPVTINGFNVGKVQSIYFDEDGSGKLKVKLMINNDFEFSKNSKAELYDLGLIGGKAVAIIPAFDGAAMAKSGDYLEPSTKAGLTDLVNQRLTPLQEKIEAVMVGTDTLLTNLNEVFDKATKENLRASVSGLNATISTFNKTAQSLNSILADNKEKLGNTLSNAEKMSYNLLTITDSLEKANLSATIKQLQATVSSFNSTLAAIESGEGSLGKLLKDQGLYNNLEGASYQLEQLLQDMKLNPKRYVHFSLFGKRAKAYNATENQAIDSTNQD